MKTSNKSNIITGAVLLLMAALFSISLLVQLFNFGVGGPGHDNVFFTLGHILYTVYGFSSLLIPVFLFITGLSCFATTWTAKRTVRLLTAIVPFYTAVITENICRSILKLQTTSFPTTKFIISLVIGLMLIVIEYLFAGIISDKVNDSYYKITKKQRPSPVQEDAKVSGTSSKSQNESSGAAPSADSTEKTPDSKTPFDDALSTLELTSSATNSQIPAEKQEKASDADEKDEDDDNEPITPATVLTQEEYAALIQPVEEEEEIQPADELEWPDLPKAPDVLPPEYDENYPGFETEPSESKNPENEKEKADETEKTEISSEKTENQAEIADAVEETDNQPPAENEESKESEEIFDAQEFTPEEFDESDPALKFPPDEQNVSFASELDDESELFSQEPDDGYSKELDISNDEFITQANNLESELLDDIQNETDEESIAFASPSEFSVGSDLQFRKKNSENESENDEMTEITENNESEVDKANFEASENDFSDKKKSLNNFSEGQEDSEEEEDSEDDDFASFEVEPEDEEPVRPNFPTENQVKKTSPKIYHDSIVENPSYPYGITIHNSDETPAQPVSQKEEPEKPKYPSKIRLGEDTEEEKTQSDYSHLLVSKPNFDQISGRNTRILQNQAGNASVQQNAQNNQPLSQNLQQKYMPENPQKYQVQQEKTEEIKKSQNLDPDFFDVSVDDEPEVVNQKVLQDEQKKLLLQRAQERKAQLDAMENQPKHTFSSIASSVFDEMEEDIRKKNSQLLQNNGENSTDNSEDNSGEYTDLGSIALANVNYDKEDEINFAKVSPEASNNSAENGTENPAGSYAKSTGPILEQISQGPAKSADDLTSDDLTAFFNAQQEENTPHTEEIHGNLPTTNRAQKKGPYVIPSDLLTAYKDDKYWLIDEQTKQASINLTQTLKEFNIEADVIGIKKGPVVTMFELLPAPGVKLSRIVQLQDNIALSLAASSVRIVAPIPGKQAVGIEVPNKNRSIVSFREIIEMPLPEWDKMSVPVILGKDILGKPQLVDLVKTPHMLIAGATGSGKSVCVNSLILSILYKRSYKDVKMILVDPKVVELKLYNNIPHLLTPVITEPKKAFQALQYCLCEMERRYALLDGLGVRDISTYNQRIKERNIATEKLPYIVVIIDEFADLMATTGRELEQVVARLTAMSRAVGIHLVLATQRPSVNVITGLIKANIPTRIAFMVASRTDSNIIIDSTGAEKLLGRGDMLYASAVDPNPIRIQGTYVNDQEVENVVDYVKQFGAPDYIDDEIFVEDEDDEQNVDLFGNQMDEDPLYDQALEIVVQAGKASASYIQRRLKIGYNRAARLVEEMEERGIVGPANGSKPREIIHVP